MVTEPAARDETAAPADGPAHATRSDRILLAAFWVWAALLLVAAVCQLVGGDTANSILDALDAKRWFAK